MRKSDIFPSKDPAASDLRGDVAVTIDGVQVEKLGRGQDAQDKPICYFKELEKGLALNVTNWNIIEDIYGDESDEWLGKKIVLFPTTTDMQGKIVDCIRVRDRKWMEQRRRGAARLAKQQEPPPLVDEDGPPIDEEAPF